MNFRIVLFVFMISAAVTGCLHQNDPAPTATTDLTHGCLLKAIVIVGEFGNDSTAYTYDASGNLIGEANYEAGTLEPSYSRTYSYKNGLVVSAEGGLNPLADIAQPLHHEDWSYEGKLVSKIESTDFYSDIGYWEHYSTSFFYTNAKLTSFVQILWNGDKIEGTFTYEDDNITSETLTYTDSSSTHTSTGVSTYYGYDYMGNPYRLLGKHLGNQVFLPKCFTPWAGEVTESNYQNAMEQGKLYQYKYEYSYDYVSIVRGHDYYNPADLNATPPSTLIFPGFIRFIYSNCAK